MLLTLTNLDNGLFFGSGGWTADCTLAETFTETEDVAKLARQHNVTNAAAAMVDGDPPRTRGFLWVTQPC